MQAETLFAVVNYGVLPAWLLLLFAPRWKWTLRIVHSVLILVVLGALHLSLIFKASWPEGTNGLTLQGAMRMFDEPWGMVACWIHYLAFDLFVGAWEVRDARRLKIPHLAVVPCIILTNQLGPTGLLVYLAVRAIMRRTVTIDEGVVAPEALGSPVPSERLVSG